jgi:nicotinamidase-related amidase
MAEHRTSALLAPGRCALVVVDVQVDNTGFDGRLAQQGKDIGWARQIIPPVLKLLASARSAGIPVLFTRNTHTADGTIEGPARRALMKRSRHIQGDEGYELEGTPGHELLPELEPRPEERQIVKYRSSAFHGTPLDFALRGLGVETVVIVGLATEGCIESTVRDAVSYGYSPVVVEDAVTSSSPELHESAMTVMRARYEVTGVTEVSAAWTSDSGT